MIKMSRYLLAIILLLLGLSSYCHAQPTRDRILGDLQFTEKEQQIDMQVEFNFPIRYLRHFPEQNGNEIRIQFDPIAMAPTERKALFKREAIAPRQNPADVTDVIYEGDNYGGLLLSIYFSQPRSFTVEQGNDYRSILIRIKNAAPQGTSEP